MSQQINLASPQLLKKRLAFGLREMAWGLGAALAAALLWAGYQYYRADKIEAQAEALAVRQATAQAALDKLNAAANRSVSALLTERVKSTQEQVAQREALLASISHSMETTSTGFAARLRALALSSSEGVWLNEFTFSPGYVALKGSVLKAELLTAYMDRLGKQPAFDGLKFSGMNAARVSPGSGGQTAGEVPEHLDFALYAGSQERAEPQEKSNEQ
ncbi:MAG: hypothetical protein IV089_02315 [Thiobacillus sp.]|nr:hypothetical protein [Thiobacillus sp.]